MGRQRHDDEQRRKKENQQMRSQQERTTEEKLRALREKEERDASAFDYTQRNTKIWNAQTKDMKLELAREAAKAENIRNDEKRAEEMPTQSEPSRLSVRVAFPRGESTTITISGHETDESDGTRRRSDSTIEVDLEKANGPYSSRTPSITTRFLKGGSTRKAKTAVTFKPDPKQPNCPNGCYIRRDNITFTKYKNSDGKIAKNKKGKFIMRANNALWTLFIDGHEVRTQTVTVDHSVDLLVGKNLPGWLPLA